ncbi:hypothetical protein ACWY38_001931 [Acinetobacter baumannii]|uniref:Uncharacterized protein n=1 Tax=Acinetobacter baumannii TaxID=470 RepID=A0A0D5YGW0_ACIBA|nr:hypothetical protein [Acinetobacter baumannii]PXA50544.1 hypothetical protein DMB35_14810 [Acinetobacter baumannii A424]AKA31133.1 hypothetical protein ABUW_1389 [Acinetobacter baumannii]AVN14978.1 hypothetical protein C6N18_12995 [Acinetobacter baumannii]AXB15235.1 hypothetical protein DPV67_07190 [Acinetobacter baumannii]EHU1267148.1 hypothetical protein [Acinetobacter baumannii]
MTDLNKERELELFNAFVEKNLPELFEKHSNGNFFAKVTYDSMFGAWLGAKAQAVPEGWVIAPQELPLDMALKIAKERILEQPPVKDPVLNEILEKAHKENIQSEQCRLMRDYKEMVKRLSESGAEK